MTWWTGLTIAERVDKSRQGWQWLTMSTGLTIVDRVDKIDRIDKVDRVDNSRQVRLGR